MPERASGKWAVLIGIDRYLEGNANRLDTSGKPVQFKNLSGCVEDILQVEQYLLDAIKVEKSCIIKLLAPLPNNEEALEQHDAKEDQPTYSNIIHAFGYVTVHANPADMVYIHYSGHGARATTVFPKLKGDTGLDEAFVPTDIACGGQYVRDLEIALLLKRMVDKGLVVTVVLDCCHSGGGVRGGGRANVRGMSEVYKSNLPADLPPSSDEIERRLSAGWLREPQGFTLLAACLQHQKAKEDIFEDGRFHGVLTYWLLDTLRNSPSSTISTKMIYRRICAKVQDEFEDQTPVLSGETDRLFFGADTIPSVHTVTVRDEILEPDLGKILELAGGKLHGIRVGSEYAIFPGRARSASTDPVTYIARVIVKDVSWTKSTATIVELSDGESNKIEPGSSAVLLSLPPQEEFLVKFMPTETTAVESFRECWEKHRGNNTWLRLATDQERRPFSFIVAVTDKGEYEIRDGHGVPWPNIVPPLRPLLVKDTASVQKLIGRISHLAQFSMVKMLENPDGTSALRSPVPYELVYTHDNGESDLLPSEQRILPEIGGAFHVKDGESFELVLKNNTKSPINLVLFNLQPLFGITQIFPQNADFETLDPGEERRILIQMSIPQQLLESAAKGIPIQDILKIFITSQFAHFSFDSLELPNIHNAEGRGFRGTARSGNALQHLLGKMTRPRRNASVKTAFSEWQVIEVGLRTWCTDSEVLAKDAPEYDISRRQILDSMQRINPLLEPSPTENFPNTSVSLHNEHSPFWMLPLWSKCLNLQDRLLKYLWKHSVHPGTKRFEWTCLHCGRAFTETVRELQPGAVNAWVTELHRSQNSDRRSPYCFRPEIVTKTHFKPTIQLSKGRWRANNSSSAAIALADENAASGNLCGGPVNVEYLLVCTQKETHSARLLHNNVTGQYTDEQLFSGLRKAYEEHRGWAWVRLRVLSHIEWKQFHVFHNDTVAINPNAEEDWPKCGRLSCKSGCDSTDDYHYSPSPATMDPPIPRGAMMHFYHHPTHAGPNDLLRRTMPKRSTKLDLGAGNCIMEGWGLFYKETLSWSKIALMQGIIGLCSLVFAATWSVLHGGAIQDAFAPSAWMLAVGAGLLTLIHQYL